MSIPKLVRTLPRPTFLKSKLIFSNRNSSPFLITVHLLVQKWTNGFFQPLLWDGPTWFSKSNKVSIVISCLDHQLHQQNNHLRHIIMIIRIIKKKLILPWTTQLALFYSPPQKNSVRIISNYHSLSINQIKVDKIKHPK